MPANTRMIVSRAILPVAGYWSLLLALSLEAQSLNQAGYLLPVIVLMGLPVVVLASIILFREAHADGSMLALRDDLTGVGNRRAFVVHSQHLMRKAKAGALGLVLLDVDGLKQLNDSCGHQAGDELLTRVAGHFDNDKGKVYRIGGDEFAVVVDRSAGQQMTRLMQALEPFIATFDACGHAHEVRVSFGSTSNRENEKFQDLFRRADDSLIQNKRQHYNLGRRRDRRGEGLFPDETSSTETGQKRLRLLP